MTAAVWRGALAAWWLPGLLLVVYAGGDYGDVAAHALTGWPVDWVFALCQSATRMVLWGLVAVLVAGRPAVRVVRWICLGGAVDAAMRLGCGAWWVIDPVPIGPADNLCSVRTGGVDLYGWGLVGLLWLAVLVARWSARMSSAGRSMWRGGDDDDDDSGRGGGGGGLRWRM